MAYGVNLAYKFDLAKLQSGPFAADQVPFVERGIPSLHLFTGPNPDYHRASDTEEKINYDGLSEITEFVSELAMFLADDEEPVTFVPLGADRVAPASASTSADSKPRRVSLGTIPDFTRESGGVLLSGVMPGSPAANAGLEKGDILISLGEMEIDNLGDLSAALKSHQPGDEVQVAVLRGEETITKSVKLVERKR